MVKTYSISRLIDGMFRDVLKEQSVLFTENRHWFSIDFIVTASPDMHVAIDIAFDHEMAEMQRFSI
jgi:hypothetical protein